MRYKKYGYQNNARGCSMIEIDARGFGCPIPVVKTQQAMDKNQGQPITVLVETAVARENVSRLAAARKYSVKVDQTTDKEFRLLLTPQEQ